MDGWSIFLNIKGRLKPVFSPTESLPPYQADIIPANHIYTESSCSSRHSAKNSHNTAASCNLWTTSATRSKATSPSTDVFSKLAAEHAVENIGNYSNPHGDAALINALTAFLNREYGWNLTADNIALTNGSQNAFFYLFNLFGGKFKVSGDLSVEKAILLPLAPEYIGYADFKYRVDFDALESLPELKEGKIGAICCSRPTNPTGNVLTDGEMARLDALAQEHGIPLIIDNAYGMPFPNIIYSDVTLNWHENIILCFSLSKVGLPGVRTGIIVAAPEVVKAVSSLNAIVNLSPTRFGAAIATPLLQDGRLKQLSDNVIRPFYRNQAQTAVSLLKRELGAYPLKIHKPEGAIFLWLWFENLPVSSQTLYEMLKAEGTLIIPGEHFFVGIDTQDYPHARECIRMSIAQDAQTLEKGIAAIGRVVRGLYDAA